MVDFKKILKRLVFSTILLIAVLVLYASFLSPIPKFFTEGIPYTAYNAENQEAMMLVHGDHLQLMYHFKLAREMITGKIPLFYNLYEFNLGEDTGRRVVDPYYIPYSLVFSVASLLFGDAFGWNISQLLSVATGFFLLFLLARRLAAKDDPEAGIIAFCSAFIASCIPYLWVTLAGGSPTGFGMSLVPGVVLGIHMAVNDRKITGGFLAGIMLLLCYTTDLHCFFFAAITLPLWCAMFWCMSEGWPKNNIKQILRIFLALLPLVICGVIAVLLSDWLRSQYAATDVAGGRSLSSVAANSPSPASIINISIPGQFSQHFNIGIGIAAVLIVCALIMLVFLLYIIFSKYDRDLVSFGEWLTGLLIVLAVIFVIMLALGTNAPKNGLPIRVARKLIPPYSMIRQPVKIFCLLPTLMALSFAISFRYLRRRISHNGTLSACSILICILVLYASSRSTTAGVSLLPKSNTAYAAVVEEAAKTDTVPRAVAIPIWPGDSAWSSLYEFYSIQNGLRMINGYSPVKTSDYMENVFHKFETIAHGQLDDEQIAALQNFGVTAIILHENAFPEKVSPFPAGVALRNLLAHPRLKLLAQDRSVWSFAILPEKREVSLTENKVAEPVFYAPARWHHFEKGKAEGIIPSSLPDRRIAVNVWTPGSNLSNAVWAVRAKGSDLSLRTHCKDAESTDDEIQAGEEWEWYTLPSAKTGDDRRTWVIVEGNACVSDIIFSKNETVEISASSSGQHYLIPAADLFHAGYTKRDASGAFYSVCLEPAYDPAAEIVYGPNLPLAGGPGTLSIRAVGEWKSGDSATYRVLLGGKEVVAGKISDTLEFEYDGTSVVTIRMNFSAIAPMQLRGFLISRNK